MNENEHLAFRGRRLRQVIVVAQTVLLLACLNNVVLHSDYTTSAFLVVTIGVLFVALRYLNSGDADTAALIFLWSATLMAASSMVLNAGFHDSAILAFPAILIYAAIISSHRVFYLLLAFMFVVIVGLAVAFDLQWRAHELHVPSWGNAFDLMLLLGFSAYCTRVLASDIEEALIRLRRENTRVEESRQLMEYSAQHDSLTDLPNRVLCRDRYQQSLARAQRSKTKLAFLLFDLDNFKGVNDTFGHRYGDVLLQTVGQRLKDAVRASDTVCRFGGDEFVIILEDSGDAPQVDHAVREFLSIIAKPMTLFDRVLDISAAVGAVIVPDDGENFDEVFQKADMAMYRAKALGHNQFRFYDAEINANSSERFNRIARLKEALANDEFFIRYQPQVDFRSGKVVCAEALIRWQISPDKVLDPNDFIPLAEETGLIVGIGRWVLKQACMQCKQLHQAGFSGMNVAINVSPLQFRRGDLVEEIKVALVEADLSAQHLDIEITESVLAEEKYKMREQIKAIRDLGAMVSIDDFGTGYSNLSCLSHFDISFLKIDRLFIAAAESDEKAWHIVSAIYQMAASLGFDVIAEGVGSAAMADRLKALGCEYGQGYFWAKSLSPEDLLLFLKASETAITLPGALGIQQ